jgi:hypothetical protein
MKNEATIVSIFSFWMNPTILLSLLTQINEEGSEKVSRFSFQDERDSHSITSNANE